MKTGDAVRLVNNGLPGARVESARIGFVITDPYASTYKEGDTVIDTKVVDVLFFFGVEIFKKIPLKHLEIIF